MQTVTVSHKKGTESFIVFGKLDIVKYVSNRFARYQHLGEVTIVSVVKG